MLKIQLMLGAGLPTLSGIVDWIRTEGGNAVTLVCICMVIYYLFKQSWGKMIGFLVVAAFVFFAVGNTESALASFKTIIDKILGNG
ncbi:TcpD family membrane protein [Bacillus toyonensis]|uniref:TcpD family membrane protein n=1 Tax=Bacillus cereus group TaxID=86661 RepID=UPI0009531B38|nr:MULTISPECIES: TcpD family membrane protein [Bacillus cereus group]OLR25070.1 hypothetical protein BLD50_14180 [Bacillus cereus]PEO55341.1 hypothetical protein CN579_22040 [Bacillus toyonensis]